MPEGRRKDYTGRHRTKRFDKKMFYIESVHKKRSTAKKKAESLRKKGFKARSPKQKIPIQVGTQKESVVKGYPVYSDNPF